MRVYQSYRAYIHKSQIPFKALFDFSDSFLQENGWKYREILFDFDIDIRYEVLELFLKKYPYWRDYYKPPTESEMFHSFTNAPEVSRDLTTRGFRPTSHQNHASIDLEKLKYLLSKIPRPLNLPNISVCFEGIDWLQSGGNGFLSFTRGIWPSGANSIVIADIEITDRNNANEILDDSQIVTSLNERYFSLIKVNYGRQFKFTADEENRFNSLKFQIEPTITAFRESNRIKQENISIQEALTATMNAAKTQFTLVKPLKKCFKGWDYKYEQVGLFSMNKLLNHGYRIEVMAYFKPGSAWVTREISIAGLFFNFHLANDQILHDSQEAVNNFVADCKRIADDAAQKLVEPLFELFGETPAWFFKCDCGK